jgi:WD40 repeat protein/serine/threonine protein kinase
MKPGCPPQEKLQQFLTAAERTAEDADLAAHVEKCPRCQLLLEQLTTADLSSGDKASLSVEMHDPHNDTFLRRLMKAGPTFPGQSSGLSFLYSTPARDTDSRPLPVIPDYEILGELGSGGMGIVYQARQVGLNRFVALKMLRTDADPQSLARFRAEAAAVARLQHPHIVQIHEIGTVEGRPFLCLEYVRGGTLSQRLNGSPLLPRPAAELVATLARAVHYAHEQGIVHRDLKPSNILLALNSAPLAQTEEGPARAIGTRLNEATPKITDFGLAKLLDVGDKLTASGEIMGTPDYMAPEQASGRHLRVGPAADIHALGVILYELLTTRLPYHGETPLETLLHVMHAEPVPPRRLQPDVPPDLETIILKCLEKEPTRRYATALELAHDLERYLGGEPIAARPPSAFYQWRKFARRNKALVGGVMATLLTLLAGLIVTGIFAAAESQQRQQSDANFQAAEKARQAARREAYQARLMAALGLLQNHRGSEAALQLEAAPTDLRGWEWRYLHSRLDDSLERIPLPPGEGRIYLVRGADGWRAMSFAERSQPYLWQLRGGTPLATIPVQHALQCLLLPSRPGQLFLLEEPAPGPLRLVDAQGTLLRRWEFPRGFFVATADLSPDGQLLALAVDGDKHFTLLDVASGQTLQLLRIGEMAGAAPLSLVFSPDGKWLASGHANGEIHLWDMASRTVAAILRHHQRPLSVMAFSPDGTRLVSAAEDRLLCLWKMPEGQLANVFQGHTGVIMEVAFSPNSQWIASAGREGTVRVWSVQETETAIVLKGHTGPLLRVLWNAEGTELASATAQEVRIWGMSAGGSPGVLRDHGKSIYAAAYSPDGRWFASGGWDSKVRLWDATNGRAVAVFPTPNWVASVAFSPDGQTLAARTFDSTLQVWDVPRRQLRATLRHHGFVGHALMHTVAISPDGRFLVAPEGNHLRRWDLATLVEKPALRLPAADVRLAVFSPDGTTLAIVGGDPVVYLVEADSGRVLHVLRGHEKVVEVVAFHPQGHKLVSAGADLALRLWDTSTGQLLQVFQGHTGEVFAAAFHPDGTRLVTGGRDRVIRIWDVHTGDALLWLEGHRGFIFSLSFSPDGHTLLSAAGDQTMRLWDDFPVSQRLRASQKQPTASGTNNSP